MDEGDFEVEKELIRASLLPEESLDETSTDHDFVVSSRSSGLTIRVTVLAGYPSVPAQIVVKGEDLGREEDEGWRSRTRERLKEWDAGDE